MNSGTRTSAPKRRPSPPFINHELAALRAAYGLGLDNDTIVAMPRIRLPPENNARQGFAEARQPGMGSSRPSMARPARSDAPRRRGMPSAHLLGIEIRAGVHTGECEIIAGKVGGLSVIIGARVKEQAGPGEILVSNTVKDLVAGSGIAFADRWMCYLKGVPGNWRLYAVTKT